jgi:uncharacterized membrane-anchored protein
MPDPITVSAILSLAFQFVNSEAGKAAIAKVSEATTEAVLKNLGKLRELIWQKLHPHPTVAAALAAAEAGDTAALKTKRWNPICKLRCAMTQRLPMKCDRWRKPSSKVSKSLT